MAQFMANFMANFMAQFMANGNGYTLHLPRSQLYVAWQQRQGTAGLAAHQYLLRSRMRTTAPIHGTLS